MPNVDSVKSYYGKELQGSKDLKTNACCSADTLPANQRRVIQMLDEEIILKFYGCGSPIPPELRGKTVLDLGCGTGRDVYLASYLVGEEGRVIGVDMTDEQLEVANKHIPSMMQKFGFKRPNVEFKKGYIEDLKALGIQDNSVDVVISNCVINLSTDKEKVFKEIFRVLKPGGELYFSDIFTNRRIPDQLRKDPVLYGECLSGALYVEDFRRILHKLGCPDHRIVKKSRVAMTNKEVEAKVGMIDFHSLTIRAFKLDNMEDICEDYGQTATYLGTIHESPHHFELDDHHVFVAGKPMLVCGNTAAMLQDTRFRRHFQITGDKTTHYGPFDCGPTASKVDSSPGGGCC